MSKILATVLATFSLFLSNSVHAETRAALVVANSAYNGTLDALPNSVNDGTVIAAALERVGFDVTLVTDADQAQMKAAIKTFGKSLEIAGDGAVGLFYYAGHGMQIDGVNYLVPIGAKIDREEDADIEAVEAEAVLNQMEFAGNGMNIVILDACRTNPLTRGVGSSGDGLARMDAPVGSFVAYSTAPGNPAVDGAGSNSPFAQALSSEILVPNLSIEEVFRRVRVKVKAETADRQVPWDSSSLTSAFSFNHKSVADIQVADATPIQNTTDSQGKTSTQRGGERKTSDATDGGDQDLVQLASLDRQLRLRGDILDAVRAAPLFQGIPKAADYRAELRYQFEESNRSRTDTIESTTLSDNFAHTHSKSVEVRSWNNVPATYHKDNTEDEVIAGPFALTRMGVDTTTNPNGTDTSESGGRISALHEVKGYLFPMKTGAWADLTYAYEEPGGKPRDVNVFTEVTGSLPCKKVHADLSGSCFSVELTFRLVQGPQTSYRNLVFVEDLGAFIPWGEFGSSGVPEGRVEVVSMEAKP